MSRSRVLVSLALVATIATLPALAQGPSSVPVTGSLIVSKLADGSLEILDGGRPVLRYNDRVVAEPPGFKDKLSADNRQYAVPRCDYIHPLYGPDGEILTDDWVPDHPHHRGVYWAWPEVDWHGNRGDLHALQHVFARPTGKVDTSQGSDFAQIVAENEWRWEDGTPIVRELATIRVRHRALDSRCVDLTFRFTALGDDVQVARRETTFYGGLNVRLSPAKAQRIEPYTDPPGASPRRAGAQRTGVPPGGSSIIGLTILQHPSNPYYPGDWVQYPELFWIQPTFPASGTRHTIGKDRPLVLRYRLWIHKRKLEPEKLKRLWDEYARE
ncbi:MAG: DUF6807 family protein [Isosphaeraceae bacterium]